MEKKAKKLCRFPRSLAASGLIFLVLFFPSSRCDSGQTPSVTSIDLAKLSTEAQQAQSRGDYRRAASVYREMLARQPHLPEVRSNLGLMYHFLGEYKEAVSSFELALQDAPRLYTANLFLGLDLLALHEPTKALPFLERANRLNQQDAQAHLGLGAAYKELGWADKARNAYEAAIQIDPKNPDAWFGLGASYLELQESAVNRLAELGKDSPYARALVAHALMEQGLPDAAIDVYQELLKARPSVPCLQADLGFAYILAGRLQLAEDSFNAELEDHPGCLVAQLGLARIALERGEADRAYKELFGIWTTDQDFLKANLVSFFKDQNEEAIFLMRKDLESASDSAQTLEFGLFLTSVIRAWQNGRGQTSTYASLPCLGAPRKGARVPRTRIASGASPESLLSQGHYTQCKRSLEAMIPPLSPAELAILCQCAFFSGDYRSSFLAAGELANHSPDVLPGLYWKAKSAERLGISALRQVGVLAPESPRLHFMLGELYRLKWQEEQAAAEYQKVLDVQPENVAARISLADAYNRSTRYNEAISELRGVLAVDGQQPDANYLMGSILVNQHQFTQALPYLETALKGSTPKAPLIHALISRVLAARGKTAEAVSELKQALGADPDGSLHYQLSLLYRKLGDQRAAAVALEQSRAISLNGMRRRQPDNISKVPPSNMLLTPRTGADYETTEKRVH